MKRLALGLVTLFLAGAGSAQEVVYYHTDALGSPVAFTDASGVVIERSEYEPYGELLNRPLTDGPGYTGHVSDAETGLSYMQQRYYDSALGVFLSTDPIDVRSLVVRSFNAYSYVDGNPYRYVDPDGRHKQDRWYGHDDRDFQRWVHKEKQDDSRLNDFTKEELDEMQEEWEGLRDQRKDRREREDRRRNSRRYQGGSISPSLLIRLNIYAFTWAVILHVPEVNESEERILKERKSQIVRTARIPVVTVGDPAPAPRDTDGDKPKPDTPKATDSEGK